MKQFDTLTQALKEYTPAPNPDQAATSILKHFAKRFPQATHAVLFVNNDFSSSHMGEWAVMIVGPGQSFETLEDVKDKHLNDLPSVRQYPVAYVELKHGGLAS